MIDDHVQGDSNDLGIKFLGPRGGSDVEEYVIIGADGVFHDGVMGIEVIEEDQKRFPGRTLGGGTQMDAEEDVHAVVRNHRSHQLMMLSGGNGGHEDNGVIGIMDIPAFEEIEALGLRVAFKNIGFQVFLVVSLGKWNRLSHNQTFLHNRAP